jgi:hypothetical protein
MSTSLDRSSSPNGSRFASDRRAFAIDLVALGVLSAALRVFGLNAQLWTDEVGALVNRLRHPITDIVAGPVGVAPHPAYDVAAHASLRVFGEHPWSIRLPAALFGIGGVLVLYLIARRIGGRAEAILASGLMAVSYYDVFYSQDARGYTTMLFFALVATWAMLKLPDAFTVSTQALYVIAAVLAAYALPMGIAVVVGHGLVAFGALWCWRREKRHDAPSPVRLLTIFALCSLLIAALYAPIFAGLVNFPERVGRQAGSGPRVPLTFLHELLSGLRLGATGTGVLAVAGVVGCIGLIDYAKRRPFAFSLLVTPIVATLVPLILARVGIRPRFLIIALPVGLLFGARGLVVLCRIAGPILGRARIPPRSAAAAGIVLTIIAAAIPLRRYYATPKQNFVGALSIADRLARPGSREVAASTTGHIIAAYYRPGFPTVETLSDLERLERIGGRVIVITSLERVLGSDDPGLVAHLHARYALARELPASQEDGEMRIYVRGR